MGPNVKFVSAITDAFSNKKMGVNFFLQKKTKRGGVRGRFGKRPYFCRIFFLHPSLIFHDFLLLPTDLPRPFLTILNNQTYMLDGWDWTGWIPEWTDYKST